MTVLPIRFINEAMRTALRDYQTSMDRKSIAAVAIGAFILGVGMALCGAVNEMMLQISRNEPFSLVPRHGATTSWCWYLYGRSNVIGRSSRNASLRFTARQRYAIAVRQ